MKHESTEFEKFDAVVGKLLSVSHKELQKREKKYQAKTQRKSGLSLNPLSPALALSFFLS